MKNKIVVKLEVTSGWERENTAPWGSGKIDISPVAVGGADISVPDGVLMVGLSRIPRRLARNYTSAPVPAGVENVYEIEPYNVVVDDEHVEIRAVKGEDIEIEGATQIAPRFWVFA